MNQETQKRLAESLTSDSVEIIPFLPYLLQDFWSLASDPDEMISLLRSHTDFGSHSKLLDLACGKGAVSIHLAKEFDCRSKGIDLIFEFIEEAKEKAAEYGVTDLCTFITGNVNDSVAVERDFDLTVWGGSGDLLGSYPKTIEGIARTVRPGGYILMDDGYITDLKQNLRFHHNYLTKAEWEQAFIENNLAVVACSEAIQEIDPEAYSEDLGNIRRRAEELIRQHPGQKELFDDYVKGQQAEYEDLQDGFVPALWLLKKII